MSKLRSLLPADSDVFFIWDPVLNRKRAKGNDLGNTMLLLLLLKILLVTFGNRSPGNTHVRRVSKANTHWTCQSKRKLHSSGVNNSSTYTLNQTHSSMPTHTHADINNNGTGRDVGHGKQPVVEHVVELFGVAADVRQANAAELLQQQQRATIVPLNRMGVCDGVCSCWLLMDTTRSTT